MRPIYALVVAICVSTLLAPSNASAQDVGASGFTREEIAAFVTSLKAAVASGDRKSVADLSSFPLRVNISAGRWRLLDRSAFLAEYPKLVSPGTRAVILGQDPGTVFENYQGIMFGQGEVWASGVCPGQRICTDAKLKIAVINSLAK